MNINDNIYFNIINCYYTKYEKIKNYELAFQIWDTVGQEQYRSLNTLFFKDAHICLLVFDITRKESFNNIRKEFCEEINAVFKYTSAKNNVCIDELFKELGYKFLHSEFMKDMSISLSSLSDSKDKILIDEKNKEKEINWEKIGCC